MAKIQFLTILLTVTCFLEGVVSVTDKQFEDLVTLVHQQAETIKQLSMNDRRQSDLIQQLRKENANVATADHEKRISVLESSVNDTISFSAVFTSYDEIPVSSPILFNLVLLNEGNGYDSTTGTFTVPPGGDGYYYFSTYLNVLGGLYAYFYIQINGAQLCTAVGEQSVNGATSRNAACSATAFVTEGDTVHVWYASGTDTTPLAATAVYYFNGFTGFRL